MSHQKTTALSKVLKSIKTTSNHIFALLRYGRINVITLFLIYFMLWYFPQGQDILVGMPESFSRVITGFLLIFALATLNWYFPRLFYPVNEELFDSLGSFTQKIFQQNREKLQKEVASPTIRERGGLEPYDQQTRLFEIDSYEKTVAPTTPQDFETIGDRNIWTPDAPAVDSREAKQQMLIAKILPRFLGIATFLIVAGGLLNLHMHYNMGYESSARALWLTVGVLVLAQGFTWAIHYLSGWLKDANRWLYAIIGLFILIVVLGYFGTDSRLGLPLLAISLVLCSLLFGIFVTIRTKVEALEFLFDDAGMAAFALILTSTSFLGFIILNFFSSLGFVFPLNALLLALIFYIGLISWLILLGKSKQTYFLSLLIISLVLLAMAWKTPLHKVTMVGSTLSGQRLDFDSYLDKWLAARNVDTSTYSPQQPFPLLVVMGEGGGSRAAYWTNLTLGAFHEATEGKFQEHCLAITTVSGSSFGAATHLAQLYHEKEHGIPDTTSFNKAINQALTFEGNFLSTSLVKLMGADFWRTVIPPFYYLSTKRDRANNLEWEWSHGVQRAINLLGYSGDSVAFQRPYLAHYYTSPGEIRTDLPLYLPNTTHVGSGNRSLISPVKIFDPIDHSTDFFAFNGMHKKDLPLATAALMSARFPYINPGGLVPPDDQFVDGGYYENIGGVTAKELLDKLEANLREKQLDSIVQIHLVTIFNGSTRKNPPAPVTEDDQGGTSPQLLVPVNAFAGTPFSGHTDFWPAYFEGRLGDRFSRIALNHDILIGNARGEERKAIMPLARYLSRSAGKAIQENAKQLEDDPTFKTICDLVN